jgi:actin-like ATPase involved in cell morphogenesis
MTRYVGLDFGTTNSTLAIASEDGTVRSVSFSSGDVFRSVLHFLCLEDDDLDRAIRMRAHRASIAGGAKAVQRYVEHLGEGRLIQSVKSFLASRTFRETRICGEVYTLVDLVAALLGCLLEEARQIAGDLGTRVVVGRPVHFVAGGVRRAARSNDDESAEPETERDRPDERAEGRLRDALRRVGFAEVEFVYEPVAAAYHYAQELERPATLLIADFGGGTSDFTVMRIAPGTSASVLATDGVDVAGDRFDARLVRELVVPALGSGERTLGPEADGVSRAVGAAYLSRAAEARGVSFDQRLLDFLARQLTLNLDTLAEAARRLAALVDRSALPDDARPTLRLLERRQEGRPSTYDVAYGPRGRDAARIEIARVLGEIDPRIEALAMDGSLEAPPPKPRAAPRPSSVAEIVAWAEANVPELAREVDLKASPVPSWIFGKLEAWHELSMLRDSNASEVIKGIQARADAALAESLEALRRLIAEERGFDLYQAVSRAKERLSSLDETEFVFDCPPTTIRVRVTRADFERWIARELAEIDACTARVLDAAGLAADVVDVVFMTGGTSMVPAVRRLFERRFGGGKVRFGGEFVSVARGLALYGRHMESLNPAPRT